MSFQHTRFSSVVAVLITLGLLFAGITVVSVFAGASTTSYIPGIVGSIGYLMAQFTRLTRKEHEGSDDDEAGYPV